MCIWHSAPWIPNSHVEGSLVRYILVCKLLWTTLERTILSTIYIALYYCLIYLIFYIYIYIMENLCYIYTASVAQFWGGRSKESHLRCARQLVLRWPTAENVERWRSAVNCCNNSFLSSHLSMSRSLRSVPSCSGEVGCPTRQVCTIVLIVLCFCDSRHQTNGEHRKKHNE